MKFIIIGITDNPHPFFPPEVLQVIKNGKFFSGGKRHHEIVRPFLPAEAEWIDITVPLDAVFEQYQIVHRTPIIVFASGDPLFFGFANTLRRQFPNSPMQVFPSFNSLQLLAHRFLLPYHDMRIVSLTGRPWHEFDRALIEGSSKIGVLTDKEHTPAAIAQRMLDYGYTDYTMHIGEHLGNPSLEKVSVLSLKEASQHESSMPNCLILTGTHTRRWGIPDSEFALLDGREKMITKMPIRLLTLQALDLPHRHTLWDIGFCTGSISIEARLLFPHLHVEAFEVRPECEALIHKNAHHFGVPGISVHIGDFLSFPLPPSPASSGFLCCNHVAAPDAVFIGGHGGKLKEIMTKVVSVLADDGIIVMNSVTSPIVNQMTDRPNSRQLWDNACEELGLRQEPPLRIQLNNYNPIEILTCKR
ncbi:MAG: precorrin-6y C5,15-methyltransferase (decarboxylating) subunit CbiE [Bacteroidaceae bacterium]|nr:precorrin-6y C5,15-methyltransferase (decarboxylating) subunit CbiE [Bacteroidaceae bacterium]